MLIGTTRLHHRARRWPAVALLVAAASMATGCALLEIVKPSPPEPPVPELSVPEVPVPDQPGAEDIGKPRSRQTSERSAREAEAPSPPPAAEIDPERLVLGQWRQGWLHCAGKKCHDSYKLEVPRRGKLRVDARAPGGRGLPDFGVVVEDLQERLVGASIRPQERPRVVRKDVEPGTYRVQVYALGSNGEMLSYDLVAKLEKKKTTTRKKKPRRKSPKPRPEFRVVKSEILEVEREGGEPTFVLIEAGERQALTPGLSGQLVENGNPIAEIKVVEVFPDGSRVRIVDRLSAPITIETTAEIRVPK
jgi:hypothetical protein